MASVASVLLHEQHRSAPVGHLANGLQHASRKDGERRGRARPASQLWLRHQCAPDGAHLCSPLRACPQLRPLSASLREELEYRSLARPYQPRLERTDVAPSGRLPRSTMVISTVERSPASTVGASPPGRHVDRRRDTSQTRTRSRIVERRAPVAGDLNLGRSAVASVRTPRLGIQGSSEAGRKAGAVAGHALQEAMSADCLPSLRALMSEPKLLELDEPPSAFPHPFAKRAETVRGWPTGALRLCCRGAERSPGAGHRRPRLRHRDGQRRAGGDAATLTKDERVQKATWAASKPWPQARRQNKRGARGAPPSLSSDLD